MPIALGALAAGHLFIVSAAAQEHLNKVEAESRLESVRAEIQALQGSLLNSREEHQQEQQQLRTVDLKIQQADLEFRELDKIRRGHQEELRLLEEQRVTYIASLRARHQQLAQQVNASYRLGKQSRLKLVLNQDSLALLGRLLAYYDYLNRAQLLQISGLEEALTTLEEMQATIDQELAKIHGVQAQQREVLERLEQQRAVRSDVLKLLAVKISNDETRLDELRRNREDLEVLIRKLADVLADIPADLGQRNKIAVQKGRLPMPVNGPVLHAFGQRRSGDLRWQGWLIGAETGAEIHAVAYGRVAFADWLRGYGLLMIIDHGEGFMSLYGHNESLLYEAGDWVQPAKPISLVGTNSGSGQGLYFELRRNGKAIDPAAWLTRKGSTE